MALRDWNWSERLKGYVLCSECKMQVLYIAPDIWKHRYTMRACRSGTENVRPLLHNLAQFDIECMGLSHGRMGVTESENPFCPHGPLYDGADSMGEAAVWHKGWETSKRERGRLPAPTKVELDGLDYLESERG